MKITFFQKYKAMRTKLKVQFPWIWMVGLLLIFHEVSLDAQSVYAGRDWSVCPGQQVRLSDLGAQTLNINGDIWWETNGDGTFVPNLMFNNATEYRFGPFDINKGEVVLTLYGRAFNPNGPVYSDQVRVFIARNIYMACHDSITVPLDEECKSLIIPEMLLEGYYPPSNIFQVQLRDSFGTIIPDNILTHEHVDQTIQSKVTNTCNGHYCEGKIGVKDYYAPQMQGKKDTISCILDTSPETIGFPLDTATLDTMYYLGNNKYFLKGWDRCGSAVLSYADSIFKFPCTNPFQALLVRRWTGRDDSGNLVQTRDSIYIQRTRIDDLQFLPNFNGIDLPAFECGGDWPRLDNGYPSPDTTGYPNLFFCSDFDIQYSDTPFDGCGNTISLYREWLLMDWCNNDFIKFGQIIKIVDNTPPDMICHTGSVVVSTGFFKCTSDQHKLIAPEVWDACGQVTMIPKVFIFGNPANQAMITVNNNSYYVSDLPVGTHTVVFTATDECQNSADCSYEITVSDKTPPYAVCDQNTVVSLTVDGNARLFAESIDDGSYDNCGAITMEIAKMSDDCGIASNFQFGDYIDFCCAEAGKKIGVSLRITDQEGLQNTCMVDVTVQDKLPPVIICPPDLQISCDTYYDQGNLGKYFGNVVTDLSQRKNIVIFDDFNNGVVGQDGIALDNCFVSISESSNFQIDNCNVGQISRIFTATDNNGVSKNCQQNIIITDSQPFSGADITWPADTVMTGCFALNSHPDVTGRPVFNDDLCSLVSGSYTDQHFSVVGDACETVIRTWTVIDWCQHDPQSGQGEWTHVQTIKLNNNIPPVFTSDCQDREICVFGQCEGLVELTASATDDCTDAEELNWVWRVDTGDDGSFEQFGLGKFFSRILQQGKYRIEWSVEDKCGNISKCSYRFTVRECKNPTPLCISYITTVIMAPDGMVTIEPETFHINSYDNCTPDNLLKLSWSQDVSYTVDTITCDDMDGLTEKNFEYELWVTDLAGNQDYCTVELIVQDNSDACGFDQGFLVSGAMIQPFSQKPMSDVPVRLECSFAENSRFMKTTPQGGFNFEELERGLDYTIKPQSDQNSCNSGINTLDLIFIQRHILNVEMLTSPYQIIAADVNNSKSISGADILEIRNLILGVSNKFNKSNCWRFVPKTQQFSDVYAPWNFSESIFLPALNSDETKKDFYIIKMGDVNGSASSLFAGDNEVSGRSFKSISTGDHDFSNDNIIRVPLYFDRDEMIMGMQFTAELSGPYRFKGIEPGLISPVFTDYAIHEAGGILTLSWNGSKDMEVKANQVLFYLVIEGDNEYFEHRNLILSDRITQAQLVSQFQLFDLIQSRGANLGYEAGDVLYQNKPNPFDQKTSIFFELSEDMDIELILSNPMGKEVQRFVEFRRKGLNEMVIHAEMFGAPGIYQYSLKTKNGLITKKLIYLR